MEIDENGVTYQPKKANDVAGFKKKSSEKPSVIKDMEKKHRVVQATNLDKSGTRLELTDADKNTSHYRRKQ